MLTRRFARTIEKGVGASLLSEMLDVFGASKSGTGPKYDAGGAVANAAKAAADAAAAAAAAKADDEKPVDPADDDWKYEPSKEEVILQSRPWLAIALGSVVIATTGYVLFKKDR